MLRASHDLPARKASATFFRQFTPLIGAQEYVWETFIFHGKLAVPSQFQVT